MFVQDDGVTPFDAGPKKWIWNHLGEVCLLLNLAPEEFWSSRFKVDNPRGSVVLVDMEEQLLVVDETMSFRRYGQRGDTGVIRAEILSGDVYIPAGWTNAVLEECGIGLINFRRSLLRRLGETAKV